MMQQADMDPVGHVEDEVKSPKVGGGTTTTTATTWGSSSSAVLSRSQRCKPRIGHTHQADVSPYRLDLELSPVVDEEAEEEAEDMETLYSNGLAYLPLTHILYPLKPENDVDDSAAELKEMEGKQVRGTKKRKRRGSRWARMGKMPKKLATDIGRKSFVHRAASSRGDDNNNMQQENFGVGVFVPEEEPEVWSESEISAFVLGLHLFGKELNSVKRLVGSKHMKDVMNYYYGPFYKSPAFLRWVSAKNSQSRRCVHGARIVSGWRQQELLLKLNSLLPDPVEQEQLLKAATAFNASKISLLDFVLVLKAVAGVDLLVQCVGVGFQKLDLSVVQVEPCSSRVDLPAGKALSTLSSEGIVNILVGDIRISKMRARDLFWEAVWPRLLAHNWRSEEIGSHSLLGPKSTLIFFHSCALDVCEADLEKGVHYFDSVSEVLDLVASNPSLLEYPGSDAIDSIQSQGNEDTNSQQECCTDTSAAEGDDEIKKHVLEPLCSEPPCNGSSYRPCETSVDLNCQREEQGQEALPLPDCRTSHLHEACSAKEHERDHQNGHDVVETREYLGRHESCCVDFLGGSSAVVAQSVEENVELPGFPELGGICNLQLQYPSFDPCITPSNGKEEADEMEIAEQVYHPDQSIDTQFVDICKALEPTQARRPDEKLSSYFGIVTRILDTRWREQADNNHVLVDTNSILDKLDASGDGCGKLLLSLRTTIEEPPQYTCIENDIQRDTSITLGSMHGLIKPAGVPKPSKLTGCVSTSRDLIVSEMSYTFQESISSVDFDNHPSNTNEVDGVSVLCTFDRGFRNRTTFEFNRIARQPKWYQEPPMLQFSALGKSGLVSTMVLLQGNGNQPHYSPSWLPSGFHKVERPIRMWSNVRLNRPVEQDGEEPAEDYGVQGLCMYKRRRSIWSVVQQRRGEPKSGGVLMSSFPCNNSSEDLHQIDTLVPIKRARSSSRPRRCIPKSLLFNTTLVHQDTSERGSGTDFLSELLLKSGAITTATPAPQDDEIEDDMLLASLIHKKPARLLEMPPAAPQAHPIQYFPPLDDELLHVDMEEKIVVTSFETVEEDLDRSLEGTELVGECVEEGADSGSSLVTTENNFLEQFSMTTCNVSGHHCQSGSGRIHGEGMQQTSEDPVTSLPEKKWPIKPLATKVWEKQNRNGVVDTLALAFQTFQSFTKTYTRSPKLVGKRSTTVWSTRPSIPKLVLTISPRKRCTVVEADDNDDDDRFKVEKSDIKEEEVSSMESNTKGNSGVKRKRSERVRRRAGWRRLLFKQDSSDDAEEEEELFFDSDFVASHFEWKYPFRSHQIETPDLQSLSQCNDSPALWKVQLSPTTRQCCTRSLCSASSCSGSCTRLRQHQLKVTAGSSKSSRSWKVEPSQHGMHMSGCTEETTTSARRPRHGIWFAPHRKSAKMAGKVKKPAKRPRTQHGSVC